MVAIFVCYFGVIPYIPVLRGVLTFDALRTFKFYECNGDDEDTSGRVINKSTNKMNKT